jgi:hypothetical protein
MSPVKEMAKSLGWIASAIVSDVMKKGKVSEFKLKSVKELLFSIRWKGILG